MSIFEAIILGLIQGLSEFIPISSTAHLTIAGKLMGLVNPQNPEQWTSFIATIQLGTLAAVFVYFAKDIKDIPIAFIKENLLSRRKFKEQTDNSRMGWNIILGSVPIAVFGLALKKIIEGNLTKDPYIIASSLIILAVILFFAERYASLKKDMKNITVKDAIIVGLSQCLALIPGSSRSGTTITAGLFLGMNRESAARFSFLLSIPAIFGSGLLAFYQSLDYLQSDQLTSLIVATLVSAISGYAAIAFLISYLKKNSTMLFIIYRIALGIALIIMAANHIL